ncbi:hypothetical protein H5410_051564 [Solanum commersonii]|uniref:Uncharacterized protein n=1 Tax=Solanum commersonii TaxID=4109 RepID=A0A9J5WYI4_SOLCO|nr:hypothetical protein H5410_051564 [Solanum commersonii]
MFYLLRLNSGLQVFVGNEWYSICPNFNAFVVNIGDTFTRKWSECLNPKKQPPPLPPTVVLKKRRQRFPIPWERTLVEGVLVKGLMEKVEVRRESELDKI